MSAASQNRVRSPAGASQSAHLNTAPAVSPPLPAFIGKYAVEAEIGKGTLVRVFRAFDRDTGRPVTLKALTKEADKRLAERFRREVANAAKLRHKNFIAIYELGEHEGLPFAAMQHLDADDAKQVIASRRPLTLLEKMTIMWQVAEGVRAAHRAGTTYIGIRPSGIALADDGCATIQDFSIVREMGAERDDDLSYAPPEELTAGTWPDALCDIFAFGITYYELLTGAHPFLAESSSGATVDTLHREPLRLRERAPECPDELERLVHRALDKRRQARYQSFDDVQYDAEPVLCKLKRARAATLLAEARRRMAAQELDEAQELIREILELEPGNRKAQQFRTSVRAELQRRMIRSRVEALFREADEEAANRRFSRAVEILNSALQLDEANPEVRSRLERACARLELSQTVGQLLAEARQLLLQQCLAEAFSKASEALELDQHSPDARELAQVIEEAIQCKEKEAKVQRELTRADSLLAEQSFDAAISVLLELRKECPDLSVVADWLADAQRQKAEVERQVRLQNQLMEARSLVEQQRFAQALTILEPLTTEFPEQAQARDLLIEARHARERAAAAAQVIAQCDRFRREERFDEALALLDTALRSNAAETSLLTLRREVEEQRQAFRIAAEVRRVLGEAQWLLDQNRPDLAAQLLRDESAKLPGQVELSSRLAAIEQTLPEWESRRFIKDSLDRASALGQLEQWAAALTVLEEAMETCPASVELEEAAERIRSRLHDEGRRKKLARRLETIGQKIAAKAWAQALPLIASAQMEFPEEPELEARLQEVQAGLRQAECEDTIATVRQYLADAEPEQAQAILSKGLESWPQDSALLALRDELEAQKRYREELHTAQVLFGRRQFQEAEQILVRLAEPNRPEVEALLAAVRQERAASEEEHFYARGREKAQRLIQERQLEQAADMLRNLLSLFPGDPILQRDLQSVEGYEREQRQAVDSAPSELPPETPGPSPAVAHPPPAGVPTSGRWAVVSVAALVLLVSASAAVWKFSRNEPPAAPAAPKRADAQLAVARQPQDQVAVSGPPAPSPAPSASAAPDQRRYHARPAPVIPRPAFDPSRLPGRDAARAETPASLPSPVADPLMSEREAPRLPAHVAQPIGAPPPPPPAPPPENIGGKVAPTPESPARVDVHPGGKFQEPRLISGPAPVTPSVVRERGIAGIVHLEATIDKQGKVTNVTVVSGNPFLVLAAKEAVLKRRYQPAMLNGMPIEAKVQIEMQFESGRK